MSYRTGLFTLISALLVIGLLYILPTIATLLWYFVLFLFIGAALSLIGYAVLSGLIAKEKYLTTRADRKAKEHSVQIDGHGMLHLINHVTGTTQNLTINANAYRNGHYEPPSAHEVMAFNAIVSKGKQVESQPILQLPVPQQYPNLLKILTQPTQSYAIIGGQQVGKTYQARRIAQHWLDAGLKPLVIGPKWDKGEWAGCTLFGGGYNFERVSQGMRIIKRLAEDRHADSTKGHKEQPIQPVFFDDWTAIRAKLEQEAEEFIIDATTLYASVNIILYFIIHLDTANAWGVGKVGAALHQNFIKLFIEPGFTEGLIDRQKNAGWLLMPGQSKRDKQRVVLFGGTGQVIIPDLVLPPGEIVSRQCAMCPNPVTGKQVYCSDACRQKAFRERNGVT